MINPSECFMHHFQNFSQIHLDLGTCISMFRFCVPTSHFISVDASVELVCGQLYHGGVASDINLLGPSNRFNISEVEVSELIETLILSVLNAPPTPALASNLEHLVLDNILNIVGHSHSFHVPVFLHQVPEYLGIIGSSVSK